MLLPVLGDQYGVVLENGELELRLDGRRVHRLRTTSTPLPIAPPTLRHDPARSPAERSSDALPPEELITLEFAEHADRLRASCRRRTERDPDADRASGGEKEVVKRRLAASARPLAGDRDRRSRRAVPDLQRHARRPRSASTRSTRCSTRSRTAWPSGGWRPRRSTTAASSTINELAAIRHGGPAVFAATHQLLLELIGNGSVDGRPHRPPRRSLGSGRLSARPSARCVQPRYRAEWIRNRTPRMRRRTGPMRMARSPSGGTPSGPPREQRASPPADLLGRREDPRARRDAAGRLGDRTAPSATTS